MKHDDSRDRRGFLKMAALASGVVLAGCSGKQCEPVLETAASKAETESKPEDVSPAEDLMRDLDAREVAIRAGDLSALPLLKHFGVNEAARASCYVYTTEADIDALVEALHQSVARRSGAIHPNLRQ